MSGKDGAAQLTVIDGVPAAGEPVQLLPPVIGERKLHIVHDRNAHDGKQRTQARVPPAPTPSHASGKRRGMLDRSLQAQLGRQLRAIFSDVAEEPVPERFIKLLEALEAKEKQR